MIILNNQCIKQLINYWIGRLQSKNGLGTFSKFIFVQNNLTANKMKLSSPKNRIKRFNSIDQEGFRKSSLSISNHFLNHNQNQDKNRIINMLENAARQQRDKRQEAELKFQEYKERNVYRQRQFHRILSKIDAHIENQGKQEIYLTEIYQKILCTFEAFNQKARQLLEDRYTELYRLMERRVDILMQKMDKQLRKFRRLSEAELRQMGEEIKEMASIAAAIQNENIQIRKKNENLEFKNKLLNEQKRLFLQQIANKKGLLQNQMKKNYQINKEVNKTKNNDFLDLDFGKNIQKSKIQNPQSIQLSHRRTLTGRIYRYEQKNDKKVSHNKTIDFSFLQKDKDPFQSTIHHLKTCLQRQKNKNCQLVRFSLELQAKQSKIKELIDKQICRQATRSSQRSLISDSQLVNQFEATDLDAEKTEINTEQQYLNFEKKSNNKQINKNEHPQTQFVNSLCTIKQMESLSKMISEINRILRLPQNTININLKAETEEFFNKNQLFNNLKQQNTSTQKSTNRYQKLNDKNGLAGVQNVNNSKDKTYIVEESQQKQKRRLLNNARTSISSTGSRSFKAKNISILYSPIDLIDITKSIQI